MIDGIDLDERCHVVALGIIADGTKVPFGLWEGSIENATVATALLADLQDRGLRLDHPILCVLDGAKALAKAVRAVVGNRTPINAVSGAKNATHVITYRRPSGRGSERSSVQHGRGTTTLKALERALDHSHASAAASLRKGMEDTLTVTCLGVTGRLKRTLQAPQRRVTPPRLKSLQRRAIPQSHRRAWPAE